MCEFWSCIITEDRKVTSLGEITSHDKMIESAGLRDDTTDLSKIKFARIEIVPKKEMDYLAPLDKWRLRIDERIKPRWFKVTHSAECWKVFREWMESKEGKRFKIRYRKVKKWAERMNTKTGEQHIYRTKITPEIKKMINQYYRKGSVRGSVRGSVWDSVWGSVRGSVWDSVWGSVRGSVWGSVRGSVRGSVWGSVLGSVLDSVLDSVLYSLGTFLGIKDVTKLKLPADIFEQGVIHAKINDEIWVWGKKGKLLAKWKVPKKKEAGDV